MWSRTSNKDKKKGKIIPVFNEDDGGIEVQMQPFAIWTLD
jgi:hypothetical protein